MEDAVRTIEDVATTHGAGVAGVIRDGTIPPETPGDGVPAPGSLPSPVILRAPIPEQILPRIRRDIIANRWHPGARLPEPQLCEEFGVSRTPLRQALRALEAEGLIRLVPHVGAIVTSPGATEVREHMEALSALEQWAVARVAADQPDGALARLDAIFAEMEAAARDGDAARYYEINDRFHREIVLSTGNGTLADLHERLMWHVCRARNHANAGEPFAADAANHHAPIMAALHAAAPEQAAMELGRHLEEVTRLMLASAPGS